MKDDKKARQVIGEAIARAMYDMPLVLLQTLSKNGYSHSPAMEIARRMVRELDHAGWRPKNETAAGVRDLEDQICFGLSMADCSRLASHSSEWSKTARDQATRCICATLEWRKIVLIHRNSRKAG